MKDLIHDLIIILVMLRINVYISDLIKKKEK